LQYDDDSPKALEFSGRKKINSWRDRFSAIVTSDKQTTAKSDVAAVIRHWIFPNKFYLVRISG
jgi:hypothetical protein